MTSETQHEPAGSSADISSSSQYPTDEIDLLDIWRVLVRQWKLIITVTLLQDPNSAECDVIDYISI